MENQWKKERELLNLAMEHIFHNKQIVEDTAVNNFERIATKKNKETVYICLKGGMIYGACFNDGDTNKDVVPLTKDDVIFLILGNASLVVTFLKGHSENFAKEDDSEIQTMTENLIITVIIKNLCIACHGGIYYDVETESFFNNNFEEIDIKETLKTAEWTDEYLKNMESKLN